MDAFASEPGSREPSPTVSALTGFDPSRFEWVNDPSQYASGKLLKVGGANVGKVFYDGVTSISVADRYLTETRLPGWQLKNNRFPTEDAARVALERFTLRWFEKMVAAIAMEARQGQDAQRLDPKDDSAGPQDIAHTQAPTIAGEAKP